MAVRFEEVRLPVQATPLRLQALRLLQVGNRIPQHIANPVLHHVADGFCRIEFWTTGWQRHQMDPFRHRVQLWFGMKPGLIPDDDVLRLWVARGQMVQKQGAQPTGLERVHPVEKTPPTDAQLLGNLCGGQLPAGGQARGQQSLLVFYILTSLTPPLQPAPNQAGSSGIASACPSLPAFLE